MKPPKEAHRGQRKNGLLWPTLAATALLFSTNALWKTPASLARAVKTESINAEFTAAQTDDPINTLDPGYLKDVGWSEGVLYDADGDGRHETLIANIYNAYPCYTTTYEVMLRNSGTVPESISAVDVEAPDVLDVSVNDILGTVLEPGQEVPVRLSAHVLQPAEQLSVYQFRVSIHVAQWTFGTIGFWGSWDTRFTEERIVSWLWEIDDSSAWLGPRTTVDLDHLLDVDRRSSGETRFLAHYQATRLDMASGILSRMTTHDLTEVDTRDYLDLNDPSAARLPEIVEAIEAKSGTLPTVAEFEILKNICDGLNTREL